MEQLACFIKSKIALYQKLVKFWGHPPIKISVPFDTIAMACPKGHEA